MPNGSNSPSNKSGKLQFYTDLDVQTGTTKTTLRFFLSDLGEHKAILGYPWFMAKVTIGRLDASSDADLSKVPRAFHRHAKVFSEQQSQRLPEHTVWDHAI